MALRPRLDRKAVRTQLNLYEDQIPALKEFFPQLGNSELVRAILDRMLKLLRENQNRNLPQIDIELED